jgi:uncharacterized protein YbjT (DUF2867 family)
VNILIFGATGMVGDGVLHECLADARISSITAIARSPLNAASPKLRVLRRTEFFDFSDIASELSSVDACFFCLGDSAVGMNEASYRRVTFDITLAAARALAAAHPGATFCYVSGEGVNPSSQGRVMWARVKGETEQALLQLPLKSYMFRPGLIRPRPGVRSKTPIYRFFYRLIGPFFPLIRRLAPSHVTTAENIGRAMITVAVQGYSSPFLENADIDAAAAGRQAR